MTRWRATLWPSAILLAILPQGAAAHAFGTMYVLPIPLWMYAYSAAATLVVSFAVVGIFVSHDFAGRGAETPVEPVGSHSDRSSRQALGALAVLGRALGLALFLLTIATGLYGNQSPAGNFSMTFFWIVFMLGLAYLTALVGDLYAAANPFRTVIEMIERIWPPAFAGKLAYPARWGYWPALAFYVAFIWIELFGHFGPDALARALILYFALTIWFAWLFGKEAWLRHGEFLGVFFRIIAMMAPLGRTEKSGKSHVVLRAPFMGLLREPAQSVSLVIFVLFMLSSTAFDGLHETALWLKLYWNDVWPLLEAPTNAWGADIYSASVHLLGAWQALTLVLSPLIYFAVFAVFAVLTKWMARSDVPARTLVLRFALTLVPIAFVYNLTHYNTLLLTEGPAILRLISDPFGTGADLFGTREATLPDWLPQAGSIWHFQVALILIGHIASVYLAHVEALRLFPTRRDAVLSQLPMLLLMVGLTTMGLWILSLPIDSGAVVMPLAGEE